MLQSVSRASMDSARTALAGVLDHVAIAAGRAVRGEQCEAEVLRGNALGQCTIEAHSQGLRPRDAQRSGRERVLGLGRADAPRQRAERTLRAGVAVGTDHRRTGQRDAEFRRDHVDDALVGIAYVEQVDAGRTGRGSRFDDELPSAGHRRVVAAAGTRVDDVVHRAENPPRVGHRATRLGEFLQRDGARALVQEDPVDRQERCAAAPVKHEVTGPDLVEQAARAVVSGGGRIHRKGSVGVAGVPF